MINTRRGDHAMIDKPARRRRLAWALALLVLLPALVLVARLPGLPTAPSLERHLSLAAMPPRVQRHIGDVLFFPLGAVLVVLARLTLGLRVLGPFRPILIAIAFRITGIPFGVAFLALTIGLLVGIRPAVKSLEMPYFGRVSVMLSAVSVIMVAALLASDWTQLETLRGAAYFPIVVLCLGAEGFDRTVVKEGLHAALGRGAATVAVAAILSLLMREPHLKHWLLRCPELLPLQIGLIVVISKFFAWRLWQAPGRETSDDGDEERVRGTPRVTEGVTRRPVGVGAVYGDGPSPGIGIESRSLT